MTTHVLDSIDPIVLGHQLMTARKVRGLTQQAVAEALGVSRASIIALEKGDRRPKPGELIHLADIYQRQVGDLVRPVALRPQESFVVHFRAARTPGGQGYDERREADIRAFEDLCRDYVELEQITGSPLPRRYPELYNIAHADADAAAEEVASSERQRLGLGDGPIGDLWGLLETDVGLRIFAQRFTDTRIAGLFVFTEAYGGCISVNARHPEDRRRWTAAHEYAHFLTDRYRAEITILPTYRRVPESERFADAFARHFLMPSSGLTRRFQAMRRSKEGPITPADVLVLSQLYQVSFAALILRLEELRLISSGSWDRLKDAGFKVMEARALLDLPAAPRTLPMLPLRFEALAVQAFTNAELSQERLSRLLRLEPVDARERVQELAHGMFFADGELYQLPLDFGIELTPAVR